MAAMHSILVLIVVIFSYSPWFISGQNTEISSSPSCGCCPASKCGIRPVPCSSNLDCECLLMTATETGMCADTVISCSALPPCENDNRTCSTPNTVCVNNTRCNGPVCYPLSLAIPNACPPLNSRNNISTNPSTSTNLPTTTNIASSTTVTTRASTVSTTTTINACFNGTRCQNNGTCEPSGTSFYCLCPSMYYGSTCQYYGPGTDLNTFDGIINGSNITYEHTVENILNRNNWTNIVAVVDVTGSMQICAAAIYKWMTMTTEKLNSIKYYVFFNDGDNKADGLKVIGSTGGLYGVENTNLNIVLATMKAAMKNGNGGDIPENDIEALLFGIKQCPTCTNVIHIADNQATPRDMILLGNVTKPGKVLVCQINGSPVNVNLVNVAYKTGGSIHTLEQDIINLSGIPIDGTVTIGTRTYKKTSTGYVLV